MKPKLDKTNSSGRTNNGWFNTKFRSWMIMAAFAWLCILAVFKMTLIYGYTGFISSAAIVILIIIGCIFYYKLKR